MIRPGSEGLRTPSAGALYVVPWLAALAAVAVGLGLTGKAVGRVEAVVLISSGLLFGLPHGAADWWVMRMAAGRRWTFKTQAAAAAVYVLAALLTLGVWRWLPAVALPGFLALTAWHFGSAEASVLMPERRTFRDPVWWMFALGRGLLVVLTSLAFRPAETLAVLGPFAEMGPGMAGVMGRLANAALPLVWIGAVVQTLAIRLEARGPVGDGAGRRGFGWNIFETGVLLMLFRVAPPLLAFACYFMAFHAWRHIRRLEAVMRPEGARLSWWRTLLDFHRRTLVLTLLSLPGLGLIFWQWPRLASGTNATVAYLILLSVLTVPHAIVIGWLDKERMKDEG